MMLRSFVSWLDSYISREEPAAVVKALMGLLAFAGLLGTIFGNQAIRVGAFVVIIFGAVSVMLVLLADRRRLTGIHDTHRWLLTRYCDFVIENNSDPLVSFESWQQKVYLEPNGDVREVLTLRAVALREKMFFVRLTAGSRWDQPAKYRSGVKVIARSLAVNRAPGPRWIVTNSWRSDRKMVSILHLHHPIRRGEQIHFEVVRVWPAKCLPLMRKGEPEEFVFYMTNILEVMCVDYTIVLPRGFDAVYDLIGVAEPDVRMAATAEYDQEGRRTFHWKADKIPPRTYVGLRLELASPH